MWQNIPPNSHIKHLQRVRVQALGGVARLGEGVKINYHTKEATFGGGGGSTRQSPVVTWGRGVNKAVSCNYLVGGGGGLL